MVFHREAVTVRISFHECRVKFTHSVGESRPRCRPPARCGDGRDFFGRCGCDTSSVGLLMRCSARLSSSFGSHASGQDGARSKRVRSQAGLRLLGVRSSRRQDGGCGPDLLACPVSALWEPVVPSLSSARPGPFVRRGAEATSRSATSASRPWRSGESLDCSGRVIWGLPVAARRPEPS